MLRGSFEEVPRGDVHVGRGVGIEHNDIVEVGENAIEAFDDLLIGDCNEPTGRRCGAAAVWHDEPTKRSSGSAEDGEGDGVLVYGDLVEQRHEAGQGGKAPLPGELTTSSTRGMVT